MQEQFFRLMKGKKLSEQMTLFNRGLSGEINKLNDQRNKEGLLMIYRLVEDWIKEAKKLEDE